MNTNFRRKNNLSDQELSLFDKLPFMADNAEIIVTKKCNLACKHCMRGKSQNETIKKEVFDAIFDKIKIFEMLNLGGGEISLSPSIIKDLLASLKENKVIVNELAFTTNATELSDEFLQELLFLKEYLDSCRNFFSMRKRDEDYSSLHILISTDDFHIEEMIKKGYNLENFLNNIKKYREVFGDSCVNYKYSSDFEILDEGRAKLIKGKSITKTPFKPLSNEFGFVNLNNKMIVLLGILSISSSGEVLPDCNFSFENENIFSVGNIKKCKLSDLFKRLSLKQLYTDDDIQKFLNDYNVKHSVSNDNITNSSMVQKKMTIIDRLSQPER